MDDKLAFGPFIDGCFVQNNTQGCTFFLETFNADSALLGMFFLHFIGSILTFAFICYVIEPLL